MVRQCEQQQHATSETSEPCNVPMIKRKYQCMKHQCRTFSVDTLIQNEVLQPIDKTKVAEIVGPKLHWIATNNRNRKSGNNTFTGPSSTGLGKMLIPI